MGKFECDKLINEYALSCVENYLLYLISEKKYQWKTIYCKSFMPLSSILKHLYAGIDYSHFSGVERLQDIAMEQGFSTLEYVDNIDDLSNIENEYYAIRVTNKYMREKYNYEPWRNDHHILLHNMDNSSIVEYLNDVPMDSGQMSIKDANKICNQSVIIFNIRDSAKSDLDKAIEDAMTCINSFDVDLDQRKVDFDNMTFEIARDAVCIAKILIRRQIQFMQLFNNKFDEMDYYKYLTSIQTKLEYMRLKKTDISKCNALMNDVLMYDAEYYGKAIEVLRRKVLGA